MGCTVSLWSPANPFLDHVFPGESSPFRCWLPRRERKEDFHLRRSKPRPQVELPGFLASLATLPHYLALEGKWILVKPLGVKGTETDLN